MKFRELAQIIEKKFYRDSKSRMNIDILYKFVDMLGDTNIKKIDSNKLDDIVDHYRKLGQKPSTIARKIAVLSKCLNYAFEERLIDNKVRIPKIRINRKRIRFLTEEEEQKLLEYLKDDKYLYAATVIGLDTGMRLSEILNIVDQDINRKDGKRGYIYIYETKNDHPRSIPMTTRVREQIDLIAPDYFKGNLNKNQVNYRFNKVAIPNLGIKDFSFHGLRHTFISRLVQRNAPFHHIQVLAGHKDPKTTELYTHLRNVDLEGVIDLL